MPDSSLSTRASISEVCGGTVDSRMTRLDGSSTLPRHTACRLYKAQIGLVAAVLVLEERRRHRNIKYIGLAKFFGKMQMTVCNSLFKCFLQTRLYNMDMTALQGFDGLFLFTSKPQTSKPASASVIAVGRPI